MNTKTADLNNPLDCRDVHIVICTNEETFYDFLEIWKKTIKNFCKTLKEWSLWYHIITGISSKFKFELHYIVLTLVSDWNNVEWIHIYLNYFFLNVLHKYGTTIQ